MRTTRGTHRTLALALGDEPALAVRAAPALCSSRARGRALCVRGHGRGEVESRARLDRCLVVTSAETSRRRGCSRQRWVQMRRGLQRYERSYRQAMHTAAKHKDNKEKSGSPRPPLPPLPARLADARPASSPLRHIVLGQVDPLVLKVRVGDLELAVRAPGALAPLARLLLGRRRRRCAGRGDETGCGRTKECGRKEGDGRRSAVSSE